MANSLISMIKGDSTLIDNTEVLDGQILFDETKQKIFLDDNERKEYGGSDDNAVKKNEVAYVESAMVATRGYSAGNYIIVQDTLYKATIQISSGTALVVGTNVSTTTVGNELTQLNNDLTALQEEIDNMGIPDLDYTNSLYDFDNLHNSFTASSECYLVGTYSGKEDGSTLMLNDKAISRRSNLVNVASIPILKLKSGDIVTGAFATAVSSLHIYKKSS